MGRAVAERAFEPLDVMTSGGFKGTLAELASQPALRLSRWTQRLTSQ